jgi:hypothetical protein
MPASRDSEYVLALVLTLILAIYILGPDVLLRFIVGLFAPNRGRKLNRTEEIARAIVISSVLLTVIYLIAHFGFHRFRNTEVLKDFLKGLYGEQSLEHNADNFFAAAATVIRLNLLWLVAPLYSVVILLSCAIGLMIKNYGKLLRKYEKDPRTSALVVWIVRPWAADWHMKLSQDLLPSKNHYIRVDVLTKLDVLYRGTLIDHHLSPDGNLVSITLSDAQKFKREELLKVREDQEKSQEVLSPLSFYKQSSARKKRLDPSQYWTRIEGRFFLLIASQIVSLNLNYVDPRALEAKPTKVLAGAANEALNAVKRQRNKGQSYTDS